MNFFRNREIVYLAITLAVMTLVFSVIAAFFSWKTVILVLAVSMAFSIFFMKYTKDRYTKISELSDTVNRVLNDRQILLIDDSAEGELAILKSEIYKMTVKLREHAYALHKEKIYLADSIADISHQIRTPLTTVNLLISIMQKGQMPRDEQQGKLREINQMLARIEWLISSLLKISKIDAGTATFRRESVSVEKLVMTAIEPLLVPMEIRDHKFNYVAEGGEQFKGDLNWSVEAIGNVIKNCMEHTPEGGAITVACSENPLYTEILVSDTGPGIAQEDLPRLFERFYRGKAASETGVGIGLALARVIIIEQNGSIKAENQRRGPGALFTIRFYKGNS